MSVERQWQRILAVQDNSELLSRYKSLVDEVVASGVLQNMRSLLQFTTTSNLPSSVVRDLVTYYSQSLKGFPSDIYDVLALETLQRFQQLQQQQPSLATISDEADYQLRQEYFTFLVGQEEFRRAASVLAGINIDGTSSQERADIFIKCAECNLEEDEAAEAELFMNRATPLMNDLSGDVALQLRYRVTFARILDANRKFLEASMKYHELSSVTNATLQINSSDQLELYGKAITCGVLAKFGSQRTQQLNLLSKDERLDKLAGVPKFVGHASLLRRVLHQRLLGSEDFAAFRANLQPHQLAIGADGFSILDKCVIEHNISAASKLFCNISLSSLAKLIRLDAKKTHEVVVRMIGEGRLAASIDQTVGYLFFDSVDNERILKLPPLDETGQCATSSEDCILAVDELVQQFLTKVSQCADEILEKYPQFENQ